MVLSGGQGGSARESEDWGACCIRVSPFDPLTLNPTRHTLHPTSYILYPIPCTLYPVTLHPTPYTLGPTHYTLHPTPILHTTTDTRYPTP
eukprot:503804-Rhodomonas_salina.5